MMPVSLAEGEGKFHPPSQKKKGVVGMNYTTAK